MAKPYLSFPELKDHGVPFSRETLRVMTNKGTFPKPIRLSPNRVAWKIEDIERWREEREKAAA